MKIINQSIKVMAIFDTNGKIEPIKFKLIDQVVKIDKVMKVYEESLVGNNRFVFVCLQYGKDIYKIIYELDSKNCYLFKNKSLLK